MFWNWPLLMTWPGLRINHWRSHHNYCRETQLDIQDLYCGDQVLSWLFIRFLPPSTSTNTNSIWIVTNLERRNLSWHRSISTENIISTWPHNLYVIWALWQLYDTKYCDHDMWDRGICFDKICFTIHFWQHSEILFEWTNSKMFKISVDCGRMVE